MIEILGRYVIKDGKIFVKTEEGLVELDYKMWRWRAEKKAKGECCQWKWRN